MIELTETQARERLENVNNLSVLVHHNHGVGNHTGESRREVGDVRTDVEKELIVNLAIDNKLNGISYKDTAKEFNIHPATLGDWTRGAFNNSSIPNDEKSIRKPSQFEDRISTKVLDRLESAIDKLTEDKIESEDANDIASIAVKMATVNEKMNNKGGTGPQIQVLIYSPKLLEEKHFDVIEL